MSFKISEILEAKMTQRKIFIINRSLSKDFSSMVKVK